MSSSMQVEGSMVLFKLSIIFIALSTIELASALDLVDLPLRVPIGSANLHATLTEINGSNKYFIQESISASIPNIKGKISISGEKDSYSVYYNTAHNFNKERLVIHGTNCLLFNFKNNWDQNLPGISKPVTNLVLLMGPSILYRLDHSSLVWTSVEDKNIRGTMMKGATTEINKRLKITYYYKKHFDESGIRNPSRIEFSGYDPYSTSYGLKENLILDIYLQNENYDDILANQVQPLPGIGCPHYLSPFAPPFPTLKSFYLHFIMSEYIQGTTNTRTFSEIHASIMRNLLRLKTNLLGKSAETFYDYQLGVAYLFQEEGYCSMLPINSNAPGVDPVGYFNLEILLLIHQDYSFRYLGKLNLEDRSGFPVDVWEATRFNVNINGKKVDKAIITQYFVESLGSKIFDGYTLVSTTIAMYKLDSSNKTYTLTDRVTRDYMNFEDAGFEDEIHDIFSLKKCKFWSSDKTITLGFKLQCQDDFSHCNQLSEILVYKFKQNFIDHFIATKRISPLRINDIEYNLIDDQIEIDVTFFESPKFQYTFKSKTLSVSENTFKMMARTIKVNSQNECLEKISVFLDNIIVVIYRPSDSLCGFLRNYDDLKEDTKVGHQCSVYHFPLNNLHRISQETPLDQIQNVFLQNLGKSYTLSDGDLLEHYKLIDVIDKTKSRDTSMDAKHFRAKFDAKLISDDQVTLDLPDVKTLADCSKNCHDSEQLACTTFSFCQNVDSVECKVSSLIPEELNPEKFEQNKTCSIYTLNILNEYSVVHNRKFKTQTSTAMDKNLLDCAESCYASPDCASFQYCDYSCSLGGFYTDAATEYDAECKVFHPKVSQYYQKTGNKIVSEVIYTEMNGNLDQCASLCHGWSDGETECKSFNYCPKSRTESSCSLTKLSVKSSDTETVEGGDCSNYELKVESDAKKNKKSSSTEVTKGTSGSGAFGIIMAFLFVGALLGFVAPIGYTKFKQLRNASETSESFTWTRQFNEHESRN